MKFFEVSLAGLGEDNVAFALVLGKSQQVVGEGLGPIKIEGSDGGDSLV